MRRSREIVFASFTTLLVAALGLSQTPTGSSDCGCNDQPPFLRDRYDAGRERPLDSLVSDLTGQSCASAAIAARRLRGDSAPAVTRALLRVARHPSCRVRTAVAEALAGRERSVLPTLLDALDDGDPRVRQAAVLSLRGYRAIQAVAHLTKAMADTSEHVRTGAAEALGDLGDPSASRTLVRALNDPEKSVRQAAAEALGRLRKPARGAVVENAAERCTWNGWLPPSRARERLRDRVSRSDDDERRLRHVATTGESNEQQRAIEALASSGEPQTLETLRRLLASTNSQIRASAARSLGYAGDRRALESLAEMTSAPDKHVRQAAVWALGQLQDTRATAALIAASRDSSPHVLVDATWSLGLVGGRDAETRLVELARSDDPHVREAVACMATPRFAATALTRLRADSNALVRHAALWALNRR